MTRHDKRMTPVEPQSHETEVAERLAELCRRSLNAARTEAWVGGHGTAGSVKTHMDAASAFDVLCDEVTNHGLLKRLAAERAARKAADS